MHNFHVVYKVLGETTSKSVLNDKGETITEIIEKNHGVTINAINMEVALELFNAKLKEEEKDPNTIDVHLCYRTKE